MAVLMMAVMVDTYVPLFGQRLGHLSSGRRGLPRRIAGHRLDGQRDRQRIAEQPPGDRAAWSSAAPLVMASGLALGAVTPAGRRVARRSSRSGRVALLVAGTGIGMAWPHLSARAMDSVDDPAESGAAAAAINTVQLISAAFGAGLAGVVVNTAHRRRVMMRGRRWLYAGVRLATAAAARVALAHRRLPRSMSWRPLELGERQ